MMSMYMCVYLHILISFLTPSLKDVADLQINLALHMEHNTL